ncbi:MAG: hypothetical protein ACTSQD_06360 [Promethearchaeota archaeon]|jgi:hypothetical protein
MIDLFNPTSIKHFFYDIYKILKETDKDVVEVWSEVSEFVGFEQLNKYELTDFLNNFEFLTQEKGNYNKEYIAINKIKFILQCITHLDFDLKSLSELLNYSGFEALISEILIKNNYTVIKNFRFTDKSNFKSKTKQKRYEVDVIGIKGGIILLIDGKQWKHRDVFSSMNKAANLQYQRVLALKKNPEKFSHLIFQLLGSSPNIKKFLPFNLIPIMVTLENNGIKMNDNQVPLISILEFNSFLQEFQSNLDYVKIIKISKVNVQSKLF